MKENLRVTSFDYIIGQIPKFNINLLKVMFFLEVIHVNRMKLKCIRESIYAYDDHVPPYEY